MKFNEHSDLIGLHAFLSPSRYHWTGYTEEKLRDTYTKWQAVQRGTELHKLACDLIKMKVKLPKSVNALNRFVNDAIGFRMNAEQPLVYSSNAFGTADAISYRNKCLRVHDLKTGVTRVSIKQLEVYAALFCLEYDFEPKDISIQLRIYQGNEIFSHLPEVNDILLIMEKIIKFDLEIEKLKLEME